MASVVCEVLLTENALAAPDGCGLRKTGAMVDFWGVVRAMEEGAEISGIDYEAHRAMAEHQLRVIAEECEQRFALMQIVVHHRIGLVPVGEASLFVRVASRHRAEGFRAAQWIVDELKKRAPIWKHPQFVSAAATAGSPA
ncbi:MAG: molybdopterin synthase catalytic subunit [Chthoniobacterales bacterium]